MKTRMFHTTIRFACTCFQGILLSVLILAGCDEAGDGGEILSPEPIEPQQTITPDTTAPDTTPPATPRNLRAVVGDNRVTLVWEGSTDPDLAGYRVKRRDEESDAYVDIDTVSPADIADPAVQYIDQAVENGKTYWYIVASYDNTVPTPNESAASTTVIATPRPEGRVKLIIGEAFNFSAHEKVSRDSLKADIVYDFVETQVRGFFSVVIDSHVMFLRDDLLVQDMGYTRDFSQIDSVDIKTPLSSYTHTVTELDIGHTYILWFNEPGMSKDLYAKIRVAKFGSPLLPSITFQWAIQEKPNTAQLAPAAVNWKQ